MMYPFLIKTNSLALFPAGRAPIMLDTSHPQFSAVRDALTAGDYNEALVLADMPAFVERASSGAVTISDAGVFYNGQPVHSYLADRMMQFLEEGAPVEHYCTFLQNLMQNPSRTSVQELYLFLEAANLPITEDGCFIAYKAVRQDFKDIHTGTIDNTPGAVIPPMPRNQVDDNRHRTCSSGYHAAAYEYAKNFMGGGRLVAVKINPRDVVSVPVDYANQKLRMCDYKILYEIENASDTLTGKTYVSSDAPPWGFAAEDEYNDWM